MRVRVKFAFNKVTGEVEMFEVDDEGSNLPAAEHNREHDRITAEIGRLVERYPRVIEIRPGDPAPQPSRTPSAPKPGVADEGESETTDRIKGGEMAK